MTVPFVQPYPLRSYLYVWLLLGRMSGHSTVLADAYKAKYAMDRKTVA